MGRQLALAALVLLLAGCSHKPVSVGDWVVRACAGSGQVVVADVRACESQQEGAVDGAWVELWSADGKRLLDRHDTRGGFFLVETGCTAPYERGMRYAIKAGAPGFIPVSKVLTLSLKTPNCVRIELACEPAKQAP